MSNKDETTEVKKKTIRVCFEQCVGCGYLVDFAEKKYDKCHWSNGNKFCPAKETQVVFGIPVKSALAEMAKATASGDTAEVKRIMDTVQRSDARTRDRFMAKLSDMLGGAKDDDGGGKKNRKQRRAERSVVDGTGDKGAGQDEED